MDKIYVTRPLLPDLDNYVLEVKDIFNSQWLTNMGVKHNELETKLQDVLKVPNSYYNSVYFCCNSSLHCLE